MLAANAELLSAHFGSRGLGGALSVPGQRIQEALAYAHAWRSRKWAERLLELSDEAAQIGESREAARAFLWGVHSLGELQDEAYGALAPESEKHLEVARALDGADTGDVEYLGPVWAALGDGCIAEAERLLRQFGDWSEQPRGLWRLQCRQAAFWVALSRGDLGETERLAREEVEVPLVDLARKSGRPIAYGDHCCGVDREPSRPASRRDEATETR